MPIVYSTDPEPEARPRPDQDFPARGQVARIWRDRKRRKGKTVTVIAGLRHSPEALQALCGDLKRFCGAGGTVRDGEVEIQGDQRAKVAARMQALGYKTKFVGG